MTPTNIPDLLRVFVLPTGPIRVRVTCDDGEPALPVVKVIAERDDWITVNVACGVQQIANTTGETVENAVKVIVDTTLQYFPREPSQAQIDDFRGALSAWVIEHRRAAEGVQKDQDGQSR